MGGCRFVATCLNWGMVPLFMVGTHSIVGQVAGLLTPKGFSIGLFAVRLSGPTQSLLSPFQYRIMMFFGDIFSWFRFSLIVEWCNKSRAGRK